MPGIGDLPTWSFCGFKPSGRGKLDYFERRLTPEQNREFFSDDQAPLPGVRHPGQDRLLVRPDVLLAQAGQRTDGTVFGLRLRGGQCPRWGALRWEVWRLLFLVRARRTYSNCQRLWNSSEHLSACGLDRWASEPCRSCDYLDICKGGCRAVSAFVAATQCSRSGVPVRRQREGNASRQELKGRYCPCFSENSFYS